MNEAAFQAFDAFMIERYGVSYRTWRDAGCMTDAYRSFHHMEEGRIVSNVSTARVRVRLEGERTTAVQIGAVGTHGAYRMHGLSRDLMRKALIDGDDADFAFLLAEPSAVAFFARFGFRAVPLGVLSIRMRAGAQVEQRIGYDEASALLDARCALSDRFEIEDGAWIERFHLMNGARDLIRRVPGCEAAVVAEGCGRTLRVYDILAAQPPPIEAIARAVAGRFSRIEMHVPTDRAAYAGTMIAHPLPNRLMVRGRTMTGPVVFPSLATI